VYMLPSLGSGEGIWYISMRSYGIGRDGVVKRNLEGNFSNTGIDIVSMYILSLSLKNFIQTGHVNKEHGFG
jgi:hypothetical protein